MTYLSRHGLHFFHFKYTLPPNLGEWWPQWPVAVGAVLYIITLFFPSNLIHQMIEGHTWRREDAEMLERKAGYKEATW